MTKEKYTPEQVIRTITEWKFGHKYGLYTKAAGMLGIESQRVRKMATKGNRGVIPTVLLRLLMAAHQEGILSSLIGRMKNLEIKTEEKP